MLYCNDELVKINEPEYEYLKSEFAKIRKMKAPIRIKSTSKIEINKTGHVEAIPSHAWPLKATVINKEGQTETWVYTENTPSRGEKGEMIYRKSIVITHGLLTLDPQKETDKVYYLLNLSGLIKSGLFEIEDLDKKNTEEVDKIGANAAVEYFICNKFSPIYSDHKKIRQLAASWGIAQTDNSHIDTVRKMLLDRVNTSQRNYSVTKRGIEEFVAEVNGEDMFTEYRSLIQIAIDKNVIGWNDKDKGWYFMDKNLKTFTEPIVFVPATQSSQKNTILFDYIRLNASLFETIKNEVYDDIPEEHEDDVKSQSTKKVHWKTAQKIQEQNKV